MIVKKITPAALLFIFFGLFSTYTFGQNKTNDYAAEWSKVKSFEEKGLTKSAIDHVSKIYNLAKRDKKEVQVIKSLLYKWQLLSRVEENVMVKMIDTLEQERLIINEPGRSIIASIEAQLYQQYLNQNRYKLYSRTNTKDFIKGDIETWTIDDLHQKTTSLFEESLKPKKILQNISLEPYDAILEKGNARYLRPTLFDLLAHRALEYFKSSESNINRPSYTFEINDSATFSPAKEFVNTNFESKDSTSNQLKALKIFQQLISFHVKDTKPLIDVDLERLQFVFQNAVVAGKETLYINALKHIFTSYNDPEATQAGYLWAQQLYNEANKDEKKNSSAMMKAVVSLLKKVINKDPKSPGAINAQNLLNNIQSPSLQIKTEKVNVPETPFRSLVTFKNINNIYFRIIPISKKQKENINDLYPSEKKFNLVNSLKYLKQWEQSLPAIDDYLSHSAEVKVDGLPVGEYLLLTSADKDFSTSSNVMSAAFFYVSNISYINNRNDYFVLDRTTGQPMAKATVKFYSNKYDYKSRSRNMKLVDKLTTDKHGFLKVPKNLNDNGQAIFLEITYEKDHLFMDDYTIMYSYNSYLDDDMDEYDDQQEYDEDNAQIFLFTDRSIYRPGQTVYYKGIGVTKDLKSKKAQLVENKKPFLVYLYNANNEKIDSASVSFNDYGSFNGKFTLPKNQLSGNYHIGTDEYIKGDVYFSMEEYKRPKYYAEFEKAKASYKVNDTVHITGKAIAYAGNPVDGAKVTYRVQRVARFIYPWHFWKIGLPNVQPLEITHGETVTDANGKFEISFAAIPDKTVDPSTEPIFDYNITADITDINGETRSADITVPVGYKSLDLQIGIPEKTVVNADSLKTFSITGKNLSGEPQNVEAELKIFSLKSPERLLRQRFWEEPDTTVMSKSEYIKYFPHDIYRNENEPQTWEKSKLVYDQTDSVHGSKLFTLKNKLSAGWYVAEATAKDVNGKKVTDLKYFRVYDPQQKQLSVNDYFIVGADSKNYEPSDTLTMYIGSSADVYLIQQKDDIPSEKEQQYLFNYYSINDELKKQDIIINESDRGGFGVMNFFVKDNRFYSSKTYVNVPWSNKKLDITFDTYRDKTLPGSKENWKVTIRGEKGNKVAAEMLASMYDASLDQFKPHNWQAMNIWKNYSSYSTWTGNQNFNSVNSFQFATPVIAIITKDKIYDHLKFLPAYGFPVYLRGKVSGVHVQMDRQESALNEVVVRAMGNSKKEILMDSSVGMFQPPAPQPIEKPASIDQPVRTNFNETAFFYPELKTDKEGNISFSFTMPEALTTWKLMAQAHTKDLSIGYAERSVITQKDLMVIPNAPRFLREGDQMEFSAKVVNMTDHNISGNVEFHLLNATTMNPVDEWFKNSTVKKTVSVDANQSSVVSFLMDVPKNFNDAVVYRIIAKAEGMSDGEEAFIPVVTNRMLVTESLPLHMRGNGTKTFSFEKLLKSGSSPTLSNYGLTVEYTPNPAWYAVQALPYLDKYPYECTEQVFNRYFANALAMHIANTTPKLKSIFEKWKTADTAALLSNLQKNEELKSVLLEETPWVMQAKSEQQQKKNIALLFDLNNMSNQLDGAIQKVGERQSPNGGFVWFKGGPDDRYMTQYILADIGHLNKLHAWPDKNKAQLNQMLQKGFTYIDNRIAEDYKDLKERKNVKMEENNLSSIAAHYLYTRSFFPGIKISSVAKPAYDYYLSQAKKYWLQQSTYMQGMIALALYRSGEKSVADDIVRSLKENSIVNEESGMYWKEWNRRGYWWYQAPIESQSLMIEVFSEISNDQKTVGDLKTWLLKNKQTNHWESTKATAEACYALLLQGNDWLSEEKNVQVKLGDLVTFDNKNEKQQAGTGYFKRMIPGSHVEPEMGNITVTVADQKKSTNTSMPSWGAVYWQYFEDLDKITFSETPLKLVKKLFVQTNTDKGPVLTPVNDGDALKIGDKIIVRIELRCDRDMEYVHMKDMRASCMEPVNVLSGYKWQGGLGYYESTRDVSTNFFFNYLPKGTYVFEYPMFVTHSGNFSNGITTIQCMYAPEFTAHSEGVRVEVK